MKRTIIVFTLFAAVLAGGSGVAQESVTPSEEAALQAYRQGAFTRAVDLYMTALSETSDPEHRARLHVNIAWTLFALGREGEVQTHLRAALLEYPELTLIPEYYTREFLDVFDKARAYAESGGMPSEPAPDLEATLASVTGRVAAQDDLEGALADLETLSTYYPLDGRIVPLQVQVLTLLGRSAEADDLVRSRAEGMTSGALVNRLSVPELIVRATNLLHERDDAEAALEMLREAVARQPSNVAALELMAKAAQKAERWQEAEFSLKSALALQPDNLDLELRLGEVYLAKKDASAARDVFRTLTTEHPRADRPWAALGLLDARLGNVDNALEELARALDENSLLPEVQLAYGELLLQQGRTEEALEALRVAQNLLQSDPQVEARMGQAMLAKSDFDGALEKLRFATSNGFDPPDVGRALALALVMTGNLSEGERVLDSIGPGSAGDGDVVDGLLQLERNRPTEAEPILADLSAERANDAGVLNLYAVSLYRQARYTEAQDILGQAEALAPTDETIATNQVRAAAAVAAVELAAASAEVKALPTR
jgi:tetratricopeptide (TPR) repeat protein